MWVTGGVGMSALVVWVLPCGVTEKGHARDLVSPHMLAQRQFLCGKVSCNVCSEQPDSTETRWKHRS